MTSGQAAKRNQGERERGSSEWVGVAFHCDQWGELPSGIRKRGGGGGGRNVFYSLKVCNLCDS